MREKPAQTFPRRHEHDAARSPANSRDANLPGQSFAISRNEEFWIELIREASGDRDPEPNLRAVQAVRAIFRTFRPGGCGVRQA